MQLETSSKQAPIVPQQDGYSTSFVTSQDGTTIGYRQLGHGPGVVLLHGAASSGYNHLQLAEALADTFTVYLADRRGRGLSGPYRVGDNLQTEVDDLEALLRNTGACNIFGVSAGAIICLQAALTLPIIRKAAIYEPPLSVSSSASTTLLPRYESEIAQGKLAAALITGMKAAEMGPPLFNALPRWLLEFAVRMQIKSEDKKGAGGYVPMREIAPTLHYDFQLVTEMRDSMESLRALHSEVLLMGGSTSPAYLKASLDALERVLPHATRIELPGVGHAASWNRDRGGQPVPVAQALRQFFA